MDKLCINTINDLADIMIDMQGEDINISVFCHYNIARKLIAVLCKKNVSVLSLDVSDEMWNGYNREYEISINDMEMVCSKVYNPEKETYLYSGADVSLVHEDCNSKILSRIESDAIYEFEIFCDENCEYCDYNNETEDEMDIWDENSTGECENSVDYMTDDMPGFTRSWSSTDDGIFRSHNYSFFSTDADLVQKQKEAFTKMFKY